MDDEAEADLAPEQFLQDDEQLNQEQFYTLQHSMDSSLTYEHPSQIVARLKGEEQDG